jgi:hypothetical protein
MQADDTAVLHPIRGETDGDFLTFFLKNDPSGKIQVIMQPFLIRSMGVLRNGAVPQNDLELLQQGSKDVMPWELSNLEDNLPIKIIACKGNSAIEKTLVKDMGLIY